MDALVREPRSADALVREARRVDALVREPRSANALVREPRSVDALARDPWSVDALVREPRTVDPLAREARTPDSLSFSMAAGGDDLECDEELYGGFLDPGQEIDATKHRLPHWHQAGVFVGITWRLADALPPDVIEGIKSERRAWLRLNPQPWDRPLALEYRRLFSSRIDELLDAGSGSCILRDPAAASLVATPLLHRNGLDYDLNACVVMPNHVHVLVRLHAEPRLPQIVQAWKSISSRALAKACGERQPIWQVEYWDRIIRDAAHFSRVRAYVLGNPCAAKLRPGEFWAWSVPGDDESSWS
ncbi:MAG: transposase [Fimbriimonadaceae bacterium]